MSTQVVNEVLREFERRRDKASALREARLAEIYGAAPRIKEIDERLVMLGIEVSRAVLTGGDAAALTAELARESEALNAEKQRILAQLDGLRENYLDGVYACALCKDTGYEGNARCACFRQRLIEGHYRFSNLNKVLKKENFESFDIELFSPDTDPKTGVSARNVMVKNLNIAKRFVENFSDKAENLLLHGISGLGKTFMCNCVAKALLDQGRSVIYVTSPQLFKMVESARFDKDDSVSEKEVFLEMLPEVDLLIIDDLGTEVSTIVTTSELFNILNSRLLHNRSTIISTNYSVPEITNIYSDRITSRLFGNYIICSFTGEDLRIKTRYKT
ncbi:MAG: ATP-binding protein [Defluviitaleaceae bacterium]|nr:ATP-binding protein [Defluviitaleaceae bacterium]MCL2835133.1 ATP-binding protein [Defluviitaleaceae bacterium]